jgi:hypothetical protein
MSAAVGVRGTWRLQTHTGAVCYVVLDLNDTWWLCRQDPASPHRTLADIALVAPVVWPPPSGDVVRLVPQDAGPTVALPVLHCDEVTLADIPRGDAA